VTVAIIFRLVVLTNEVGESLLLLCVLVYFSEFAAKKKSALLSQNGFEFTQKLLISF